MRASRHNEVAPAFLYPLSLLSTLNEPFYTFFAPRVFGRMMHCRFRSFWRHLRPGNSRALRLHLSDALGPRSSIACRPCPFAGVLLFALFLPLSPTRSALYPLAHAPLRVRCCLVRHPALNSGTAFPKELQTYLHGYNVLLLDVCNRADLEGAPPHGGGHLY
ncbi:hypothetical protein B0H14DRAFT_3473710 [Mycena olivaceomarginata]|nr:hypothetical protein B0H14DRAFT_3473710 [Mycena olivaceomarginata]